MADEKKETMNAEQETAQEPAAAAAENAEGQTENADATAKKSKNKENDVKKKLEAKEKELSDEKDKYLRLYAEYDNFRRRSAKEKEGVYADAYADALSALLPILDNLDRAAQFTDAEAVAKGLDMTRKSFDEALTKMGVTEMDCLGKTFDPNRHNAVMHDEDETKGEGEIVEVFQKGYVKGDRVIRYAMVKVVN